MTYHLERIRPLSFHRHEFPSLEEAEKGMEILKEYDSNLGHYAEYKIIEWNENEQH